MEEFQERVVEERKQLDELRGKLELFLGSSKSEILADDERARMLSQKIIMRKYSDILGDRIAAFSA